MTTSRRAIVDALLDAGGHVSADELARRVQAGHPDVHQSTVYRTLETLAELGVVEHVHFPHGPAVFDLTDMPHHHLVCSDCGSVVEIPTSALAPLADKVEQDHGFAIDTQHFALSGLCANCRAARDA